MNRRILPASLLILLVSVLFFFSCAIKTGFSDDPNQPILKLATSPMFRNYMVLQRNKPVAVWGKGHPHKTVLVLFQDQAKTATVDDNGYWILYLDPLEAAFEPQEMDLSYLEEPEIDMGRSVPQGKTFRDILIGDVWLCSGQSNMEYGMAGIFNKNIEYEDIDYPDIRIYLIYKKGHGIPQSETNAAWFPANRSNLSTGGWNGFSAVAFTFGRKIYNEENVPIGLIQAAFGGSKIEAWIPPEELDAYPELESQYKVWKTAEDYWAGQLKDNPDAAHPFSIIGDNYSKLRPATAFNAMINPVVPYGLRGFIWYQGESDVGIAAKYAKWMEAMISGWRREFNQGSLPFYYVQLAPYKYNSKENLPKIWEAQTAALAIENTGMAVTIDIGTADDIHPKNKRPVGERLAFQALAGTYGRTEINPDGPLTDKSMMEINGSSVTLEFRNAADGLVLNDGETELKGFEIAGSDGIYFSAGAVIDGNMVIIESSDVPDPVSVRYAWNEIPDANLANSFGLPARPFRIE